MEAERNHAPSGEPKPAFDGWNIVVMGGSRGIGRAVTLGFAERGGNVAACGRGKEALDALAAELAPSGRESHLAVCDVGDAGAISTFVSDAAAALGGVDVLVNCASAIATGNGDDDWFKSFNIDLLGSVHAADAALSFLKRSAHASIVNMASVAALKAVPARSAYGAIKAAIMHQTASSALALAPNGIRVNCVVPGSTEARGGVWERKSRTDPDLYRETRANIPLGRFAPAENLADVGFFLASPAAAWITGQSSGVDGGQSLVTPGA